MVSWRRYAVVGIMLLSGALTVLWYGSVWSDGGEFRRYLIYNAIVLFSLSFALVGLRFTNLRIAVWITSKINRWLILWAGLGLLLPVLLFIVDRREPYLMSEPFLFTLWPSNVTLLALGESWDWFLTLMSLSLIVNATLYAGLSMIAWWSMSWFQRVRRSNGQL
jgi:hypothetical protein